MNKSVAILSFNMARIYVAAVALAIALPAEVMATQSGTAAPVGFQIMCLRNPTECQGGGANRIQMDNATLAHLDRVNRAVNKAIKPRADGRADRWNVGKTVGDCEDYVLAKRARLIADGFPPSAMRIAYVKTSAGEGHAILVVKTDQGDYVLDNLSRSLLSLRKSGYQVLSMSGADPLVWN
jgi:predicted transglutaminase-like cysteine proteinase